MGRTTIAQATAISLVNPDRREKMYDDKLAALQAMLAEGRFHHATHRTGSGLWSGLWIYERTGVKGGRFFEAYKPALCFYASARCEQQDGAYALVRGTGVSLGAYGRG